MVDTYKPTPPYAIYIWTNLSLLPLESDGRAAYMEIHPNLHYHTQPCESAQYVALATGNRKGLEDWRIYIGHYRLQTKVFLSAQRYS